MFRDKVYLSTFVKIALPITLQTLITSSLNLVDVLMIGQMGEVPVAAVGLANQIFFLLNLLLFGISSGSAVFIAQYWGQKDETNIRRVQGLCLAIGAGAAVFFSLIALVFPRTALGFYTNDQAVIDLGSEYLKTVGYSYIFIAVTYGFSAVLRSTENVKLPMISSMIALSLNTVINYTLIFGNFGFPQLGVKGAAIATVISRILECGLILYITYKRKTPAAAKFSELWDVNRAFIKNYFKTAAPVIINEAIWSFGITTYNAVYAHIGTDAIAAVNISSTIENLAFVMFIGVGNACAIMVGKQIGSENEKTAYSYAGRSIVIAISGAIVIGLLVVLFSDQIISLYNISENAANFAHNILRVSAATLWIRATNMTTFVGILRSGGDTRYALLVELFSIWTIGVPLAFIGGFALHLAVHWVYLLVTVEEFTKFVIGLIRYFSKKWIHNLVHEAETAAA